MLHPYYDHAGIQIFHGDCRQILPQLPKVDLVLTDPPYGIKYRHSGKNIRPIPGRKTQPRALGVEPIVGDDKKFDPRPLLNFGKDVILWGAHHYANLLPNSNGWLVWNKLDGLSPSSFGDCDLAWRKLGNSVRMFIYMWRGICQAGEKGKKLHPAQKPLELMRWCIMQSGKLETVLDPFMGSGTTLRAAKDLGRKAIGIEIEEKYCEIAAKRLSQEVLAL